MNWAIGVMDGLFVPEPRSRAKLDSFSAPAARGGDILRDFDVELVRRKRVKRKKRIELV